MAVPQSLTGRKRLPVAPCLTDQLGRWITAPLRPQCEYRATRRSLSLEASRPQWIITDTIAMGAIWLHPCVSQHTHTHRVSHRISPRVGTGVLLRLQALHPRNRVANHAVDGIVTLTGSTTKYCLRGSWFQLNQQLSPSRQGWLRCYKMDHRRGQADWPFFGETTSGP
jgi:hypothetical protein